MSNTRMYYVLIVLLGVSSLASGRSLQSSTFLAMNTSSKASPLPIVLWHGLGDSCCSNNSIGYVANQLRENLNVFVYSIATGSGMAADVFSTYYGNVNQQVAKVCQELAAQPELAAGYNAVGFSQGGQFMRAVVERCQHTGPKAHTLVTMGAQHQGIMNVPECWNPSFNMTPAEPFCWLIQRILGQGAYLSWVQNTIVQAQYFKDPYNMDAYLKQNHFLPDINNEYQQKDDTYKTNLASLKKLVLFRFEKDVTVVPLDSAWFSFFDGEKLLSMNETDLYLEDWIGLKELDDSGRLILKNCPTGHMQFSMEWFNEHVVTPYLSGAADIQPQ